MADRKALRKLKAQIKSITHKTIPASFDEPIARLNFLQAGWINYFKCADMHGKCRDIDVWIRRPLRGWIWHDWKKPNRKIKNLIRLGIPSDLAYAWSRTRRGRFTIACSSILSTTMTNA